MSTYSLDTLMEIIVSIACGCVLPIMAIWFVTRMKSNESKDRTKIVLTAIEKNPDMDLEELMKKMTPQRKSLKERMLSRMMWGTIITFIGACFTGFGIYGHHAFNPFKNGDVDATLISTYGWANNGLYIGVILLAVGIALLLYYFIGKKVLAKEIEAEERKLTEQA